MKDAGDLTAKQEAFCHEYIVDFNAAAAARRAGYTVKSAALTGYQNLTKTHIQVRVAALIEARMLRVDFDADQVLAELKNVALFDPAHVCSWSPDEITWVPSDLLTPAHRRCVRKLKGRSVTVVGEKATTTTTHLEVEFYDRLRALELAGRHTAVDAFVRHDQGALEDGPEVHRGVALTPRLHLVTKQET